MKTVDVRFRLTGSQIPADHGYHLYAAISRHVAATHENPEIGLHPIAGRLVGNRMLALTPASCLRIRIEAARLPQILPLAGKTLDIGGCKAVVGTPDVAALVPSARLYSRLVTIKKFMQPADFLDAANRQLQQLEIRASARLVDQQNKISSNHNSESGTRSPVLRRTLRIRDKEIVGFALRVEGLTADESIRLQEAGIGGRRKFGCGIFLPDRG